MYTPIQRYAIIVLSILVLGMISAYAALQARDYLSGPEITITAPTSGSVLNEGIVHVSGTAERIAELSLNGRQIFTDENGVFDELLLLAAGYNAFTVVARDKFNRTVTKTLEVVYKE